jgi:DNA (cytosine-5)-methyltransferase 1
MAGIMEDVKTLIPKPRALDLFCGAGGVSVGLQRAGFDVTGVDINPQPHHRGGHFIQADALEVLQEIDFLLSFDFIWASPPCQRYSSLAALQKGKEYPDLIPETRARLQAAGVPYCIENVPGAPLGETPAPPWASTGCR